MRKFAYLISLGLGTLAILLSSTAPVIGAAASPTNSGQALEIAPPVINLTVNPGQTVNTQISLRDVSKGNLIVTGQANDFVAAGEDGTPKILMNNDKESDPYSLKNWVQPLPSLLMVPKQIKKLPITILVPKNASPGGHYGVIRFTATPPELKGTGVSLSASLGSLVLLTVRGDIKDQLVVQEFSLNKNGKKGSIFESTPLNIVERIKNTGNNHEEPTGLVTITNIFGKPVAAVNVNMPPHNVLPGSVRMFEEPLNKSALGTRKLFGRYKATMKLTYGKNQVLTASVVFWIIPYKLIAAIVILLVGGFFLIRYLVKRHDEKIMRRLREVQQNPYKRQ